MGELALLDRLEIEESRRLSWGLVDGGFRPDEVEDLAAEVLGGAAPGPAKALMQRLIDRRMLFRFPDGSRQVLRTRMAETVRLLFRLRQVLPWNEWRTAPTLVADYRFAVVARRYPARVHDAAAVLGRLDAERPTPGAATRGAVGALLNGRPPGFRLASFQVVATTTLLRDVDSPRSRGMIVCAGTGTGKTLAFYLPALATIAPHIDATNWTKVVAIYPRVELLKDQFADLYREARRLDPWLVRRGARKIRLGAFFGETPYSASAESIARAGWIRRGPTFVCPFARCPDERCEQPLVWREEDIRAGRERLACSRHGCPVTIGSDEVILTRTSMAETPPDILFATTEMMNRQMGDHRHSRLFGVGATRVPLLLLLDEVHTYSGVHGAQVAYLIRRFRNAIGGRVHVTGLSATLRGATDFFAQLTGIPPLSIAEIDAACDPVDWHGHEYRIALKGDRTSGTSLLSTTIQTAMLLRRVLEPPGRGKSPDVFGRRLFAFNDDLDLTNRLFHNLLDAEACNSRGDRDPTRSPLAAFRAQGQPDAAERLRNGQCWRVAEEIGHDRGLGTSLRVGRTSSQDAGVDRVADVVVATASLEVGYDDPEVGAVLQHKAPHNAASFLQRKGRGGRRRGMRPWTALILTDFGRDRLAFDTSELVFDPELMPRVLPLANRHVLRMQAVYALLDWIGPRMADGGGAIPWMDLAGPPTAGQYAAATRKRQEAAALRVRTILEDRAACNEFERHVAAALQISPEEVAALLWEPPRPVLTAALPTLLRRLESGWRRVPARPDETPIDFTTREPLPEFVPPSLFKDLNLPDVSVRLPPTRGEKREPTEGLLQALTLLAPGRVLRRYGVDWGGLRHWLAPRSLDANRQDLILEDYCAEFEEEGIFESIENGVLVHRRVVRPLALALSIPPVQLGTSTNARLVWRTQIIPASPGDLLDVPPGPWRKLLPEVRAFTHERRAALEVRRFAIRSEATLLWPNRRRTRTRIEFVDDPGPCPEGAEDIMRPGGVGFKQDVDGLVFRLRVPDWFDLSHPGGESAKVRAFRTMLFRMRVVADARLDATTNVFQRERLVEAYASTLVAESLASRDGLSSSWERMGGERGVRALEATLEAMFVTIPPDQDSDRDGGSDEEPGPDDEQGNAAMRRGREHEDLLEILRLPEVIQILHEHAQVLFSPADASWHQPACDRLAATLGAALMEACERLCPHVESGDLVLDLDAGPLPRGAEPRPTGVIELWITEATLGGAGLIEEILRRYADDPAGFFRLVESALQPGELEVMGVEIARTLDLAAQSPPVAEAMEACRTADGHAQALAAAGELRRLLEKSGVLVTHTVATSLHARILRPGSSSATDALVRELFDQWRTAEEQVGIEIDARVFALAASADTRLDTALSCLGPVPGDRRWRTATILGLLWPRGGSARALSTVGLNRFTTLPDADRRVLQDVLRSGEPIVSLDDPDWYEQAAQFLADRGAVVVRAPAAEGSAALLRAAILGFLASPIEMGYLLVHARLETIERAGTELTARLRIEEAVL